jgi:hypothetical protein
MKRPKVSDLGMSMAAGAVGTIAMDTLWWRRARAAGSDDSFVGWEFSTGTHYESFADAPAPGRVGQRLAGTFGVEVPVEHAGLTTDVVHWATGMGWGAAVGSLTVATGIAEVPAGLAGGAAAVGTAYGALGAAGIYEPVWEYDLSTLRKDLSAHLVFGFATGVALWGFRKMRSA